MNDEHWVVVADHGRELGTSYEVELVVRGGDQAVAQRALEVERDHCHRLDASLSEWRDDSEISRLNQQAFHQAVPVSDQMERLLSGAVHVAKVTGGAFDFAWAPLGLLWDRAEARARVPDDLELAEVRRHLGFEKVSLKGGMIRFATAETRLGIASFAKGWIIDAIFHGLRRAGFANVVVNIGGDLRTIGHDAEERPQVFRVLDPYQPSRLAAELPVPEGAVATSGNYFRRRWIDGMAYGHLFDPATGRPPEFDGSVTVLAADAAMADALATALFVMGPERGLEFARRVPGLEVLYLTRAGPVSTDSLRLRPGSRFAPAAIT